MIDQKELYRIIDQHADQLGEHFEAVQILATTSDGDCSLMVTGGNGNFYARRGMAQTFIDNEAADRIAIAIGGDPDDGGEEWKSQP